MTSIPVTSNRYAQSQKFFQRALAVTPGGVHSPVRSFKGLHTSPLFMNRAQGAWIFDEDHHSFIDFCMSFGPLILGHQDQDVKEAIMAALNDGWTYGACEKYSLELAEFILQRLPFLEQIRFMSSGTEAVMTAIRLARGHTQKSKIIKFDGCYHGHMDALLVKSGSGLAGTETASSLGVTHETIENTLVCPLGDIAALRNLFAQHKNSIAALIIEPLPANYGLLIQARSFLEELPKLCHEYQSLLIFDEVISGFRMSFGGMAELYNITPDLVTYGKVIGGGMPVGAVAGKKAIMQNLAPLGGVYQAGTLSANPVAMRAGLMTLQKIAVPSFYQTLDQTSEKIVHIFEKWSQTYDGGKFSHLQWVRSGSLFWPIRGHAPITKVSDLPSSMNEDFYELFKVLLEKGIYLAPNGYEVGFVSSAHQQIFSELETRLYAP